MLEEPVQILTPAGWREVGEHLLSAVQEIFGELAEAIILKGSLVKGDFIPYFSDVDLHVFAQSAAMEGPMVPKLEYCLEFQSRFGDLDPEEFGVSQFQVYFLDIDDYPRNWTPPLPGTYRVIWGAVDIPLPTEEFMCDQAHLYMRNLPFQVQGLIHRFIDKPDTGIAPLVRLLGVFLKPAVYELATLLGHDPIGIWTKPLDEVLAITESALGVNSLGEFYQGVRPWQYVREQPDKLRHLFGLGVRCSDALAQLYNDADWGRLSWPPPRRGSHGFTP